MLSYKEMRSMKKIVTAFALVALAASPALAKTYHQRKAATPMADQAYVANGAGNAAYAAVEPGQPGYGPAVISYGVYAGWDPSPTIRLQLMKDPGSVNAQ
jgi:hypothetical protein